MLKKDTIWAAVMSEKVDEREAKAISLTENLIREGLSTKDKIDACTWLYLKYGTIKAVAEATALPASQVSKWVKYDRLVKPMKELVDDGLNIKAALRAQDAATKWDGAVNVDTAVHLAKEMGGMSDVNRAQVVQELQDNPDAGVNEVLERAKSGGKLTQITVTIGPSIQKGLRDYADDEDLTQADAAASLIEESLSARGLLPV